MEQLDIDEVRESAIRLLARREHSRTELAWKLVQKGLDKPLVDQALEELGQEGLLSDRRYAESFVASRIGRGQGPLKIRAELASNGVPDELIEAALTEANTDWRVVAAEIRRKRFGESLPDDYTEKARQARFMAARGFTSETIWKVLGGEV